MPETPPPLVFDTGFAPETGHLVEVLPGISRLTAPNAGPYTFTGTGQVGTLILAAAVISSVPRSTTTRLVARRRVSVLGSRTPRIVLGVVSETAIALPWLDAENSVRF